MASLLNATLDWGLLFIALTHIRTAPFTKVEESFNLHAIHDVIMYNTNLHNYDHFTFPGVVPRTFIGSLIISLFVNVYIWIWSHLQSAGAVLPKMVIQQAARLVLMSFNLLALRRMRIAVSRRFDSSTSFNFTLLSMLQFHLPFWIGRTIPNMFAFAPVTLALSLLIDKRKPSKFNINSAIALLTFTTVIFRAEVLLLLAPISLQSLYLRHITFPNLLLIGLLSGFASLLLTLTVDSYFWDTPYTWPELYSLYFNVYKGKSSEWGTSSPLSYFLIHLPKLLTISFPLSILGLTIDKRIRTLLLPSVVFIGLMSFLPHKEWRFIVYVIPMFTVAAARGTSWISHTALHQAHTCTRTRTILLLSLYIPIISSALLTSIFTYISMQTYPGGNALTLLHEIYLPNYTTPLGTPPHIHICNLAAQTGASLFTQLNAPPFLTSASETPPKQHHQQHWIYNKTENLSIHNLTLSPSITHLISEVGPESEEGLGVGISKEWRLVGTVRTPSLQSLWLGLRDLVGGGGWRDMHMWMHLLKGERLWMEEDRLWIYERRWSGRDTTTTTAPPTMPNAVTLYY